MNKILPALLNFIFLCWHNSQSWQKDYCSVNGPTTLARRNRPTLGISWLSVFSSWISQAPKLSHLPISFFFFLPQQNNQLSFASSVTVKICKQNDKYAVWTSHSGRSLIHFVLSWQLYRSKEKLHICDWTFFGFSFLPKLLHRPRWLETYKNKAAMKTAGHLGIASVSFVTSQQAEFPEALVLTTSWKVEQAKELKGWTISHCWAVHWWARVTYYCCKTSIKFWTFLSQRSSKFPFMFFKVEKKHLSS